MLLSVGMDGSVFVKGLVLYPGADPSQPRYRCGLDRADYLTHDESDKPWR